MNVALSRLPSFTALPGEGDHLTAGIIMAPSLAYMDRAYLDARAHGWSREPVVEMLIPSTLDETLAPVGQHVASLFCQHVAPELPDGTLLGRPSRGGRRSHDRDRRPLCARLRAQVCLAGRSCRRWTSSGSSACSAATSSTAP